MKNLSFLAILSLLAITLPLTIARDPDSLQDFCVSTNSSLNGAFVNGRFCKDPRQVTAADFSFSGLNRQGPLNPVTGSFVTQVSVNELPGLNTLGISIVRIDYGVNGQNPPHYHPRATEVINLQKGKLLVGFITSNPENRLIGKILKEGDVFVFPQAMIHFQQNIGHKPAVAFSSLSSQNPGVVSIANAVFGSNPLINSSVLAKAFQLDPRIVMELQNKFRKQ